MQADQEKLMTTCKTNLTAGIRHALLTGSAILGLTFLTATAHASCMDGRRSASQPGPSGQLAAHLSAAQNGASNSIVGLWHVTYTTSDNQPFQESFDMWHSDGTELETANVNPVEGNFCLGVWEQMGKQVHLHHVGWAFDEAGNLVGPFTVDTVAELGRRGNSYSGNF